MEQMIEFEMKALQLDDNWLVCVYIRERSYIIKYWGMKAWRGGSLCHSLEGEC